MYELGGEVDQFVDDDPTLDNLIDFMAEAKLTWGPGKNGEKK